MKDVLKATAATGFSARSRPNSNAKDKLSDHRWPWTSTPTQPRPRQGQRAGPGQGRHRQGSESGHTDRQQAVGRRRRAGGRGPARHQQRLHPGDGERGHAGPGAAADREPGAHEGEARRARRVRRQRARGGRDGRRVNRGALLRGAVHPEAGTPAEEIVEAEKVLTMIGNAFLTSRSRPTMRDGASAPRRARRGRPGRSRPTVS